VNARSAAVMAVVVAVAIGGFVGVRNCLAARRAAALLANPAGLQPSDLEDLGDRLSLTACQDLASAKDVRPDVRNIALARLVVGNATGTPPSPAGLAIPRLGIRYTTADAVVTKPNGRVSTDPLWGACLDGLTPDFVISADRDARLWLGRFPLNGSDQLADILQLAARIVCEDQPRHPTAADLVAGLRIDSSLGRGQIVSVLHSLGRAYVAAFTIQVEQPDSSVVWLPVLLLYDYKDLNVDSYRARVLAAGGRLAGIEVRRCPHDTTELATDASIVELPSVRSWCRQRIVSEGQAHLFWVGGSPQVIAGIRLWLEGALDWQLTSEVMALLASEGVVVLGGTSASDGTPSYDLRMRSRMLVEQEGFFLRRASRGREPASP
jgi:hypothetical protein